MFKARFKTWGLPKYLHEAEVRAIALAKAQRDAAGKASEILRSGAKVDFVKVVRHLERKGKSHLLSLDKETGSLTLSTNEISYGFQVITPPPRELQSPDPQYNIETILLSTRIWYQGNVDCHFWRPTRNLQFSAGTKHMVAFQIYFHTGARGFLSQRNHTESFRFLNLAFAHLQPALQESYPALITTVAITALRLLELADEGSRGLAIQLYRKLFSYLQEMSVVRLGRAHPLSKLWFPLEQILIVANCRHQLAIVARLIKDNSKLYFGFDNELVYSAYEDYWEIEATAGYIDYREVAWRDLPGLISVIDSRQSIPENLRTVIGKLKLGLVQNLHMAGEYEEALVIVSNMLADPLNPHFIRYLALRQLSSLEIARGNWLASQTTLRKALELISSRPGRLPQRLSVLRHLVHGFKTLGDVDAMGQSQVELERRMRHAEEAVGIGSLNEMMSDFEISTLR